MIEGERDCFRQGAEEVGARGFDTVIFGHTHLAGTVRLSSGARYYNTGGWFSKPHCVAISNGQEWFGSVEELTQNGGPVSRCRTQGRPHPFGGPTERMSNLATPIEQLAREYDVVVVGSGYGGAIAASRFARAGRRVCLLERGEERHPGDFPENSAEGLREIQADSPDRRIGSSTALFDLHINPDISVLSGCGLGGTSLINANVAIPPDERVWADPLWPDAIRADVQHGVAQGVRRAQEMLRPTPLPSDQSPPKLQAMEKSAQAMGARFERLPITVNFEDRINHVGVEQPACNSCGNCVGGCNVGAKNTLMMNYLPDARNHGAEIFTCTAVRRVERRGTRWVVHFDLLEAGPKRFNAPGLFVAADVVVLAAGSLGSTEILLRSRESGLPVSDRLGEGFTGNGDVLGFAYNADQFIGGVGVGSTRGKKGPGPCITSVIDLRGTDRLNDGMIIEEGVIPSTLGPILAPALLMASRAVGEDTDAGLRDYAEEKYREIQALVPGGSTGAVGNTQTFLVMAHDDSAGRIHLADDRVRIAWPGVGSQAVFDKINGELLRATAALGGTYVTNPLWTKFAGKSLVTVHPLGGCGMGETSETGVVDHRGRVFSGESGDQVHDGLYVSDGSVIPRSLGVNPLLTISALAERTADLIARDRGWEIPYDLPSAPRAASVEKRVGVQFTEAMRGFFSLGSDLDFAEAAEQGKESDSPLEFTLTVNSDDLYDMLRRPDHSASLYGSVSVPALSTEPFSVTKGTFHLLTVDPDEVRTRRMTYKMPMEHPDGRTFFLHGFKRIHDDRGFDVWSDTTTLFVSVHEGEDESGPVVGRGVLRIKTKDFSKQLRTFKITNAGGIARRLKAMADFGKFFAGALYDTYGGVLAPRSTLDPGATARTRRELVVDPPDAHYFSTADGVSLRLVRYEGGSKGPVLLVHGLGMSGQVFAGGYGGCEPRGVPRRERVRRVGSGQPREHRHRRLRGPVHGRPHRRAGSPRSGGQGPRAHGSGSGRRGRPRPWSDDPAHGDRGGAPGGALRSVLTGRAPRRHATGGPRQSRTLPSWCDQGAGATVPARRRGWHQGVEEQALRRGA